jgi:hypothetical protein
MNKFKSTTLRNKVEFSIMICNLQKNPQIASIIFITLNKIYFYLQYEFIYSEYKNYFVLLLLQLLLERKTNKEMPFYQTQ